MKQVNVRELHERTGAIVDLATKGRVVTIFKRGRPVADCSRGAPHFTQAVGFSGMVVNSNLRPHT